MNQKFLSEFQSELAEILNWWGTYMPDINGNGFIGKIDNEHKVFPDSDRGVILNTRILWTFAAAARQVPKPVYKELADRAFHYLNKYFIDPEQGGVFWMLDASGKCIQDKKQVYAQAFAIYAYTEYYLLCKEPLALDRSLELFRLIEKHSKDRKMGGYFEAFDRAWKPLEDLRLSEKDANEAKTMNTHLHVLEAYTNLYRIYKGQELAQALTDLILCFLEKFIDPKTGHLHLFFDENWKLKSHEISFGHDIECSWLLYEAAEVLNDKVILREVEQMVLKMAESSLHFGLDHDGSVFNEKSRDHIDKEKHWWPQAEAVIGFWNAWQLSSNKSYQIAAKNTWTYIKNHLKDPVHGEWFWGRDEQGEILKEDKAGPWKAPYHNGRMCLEMMRRIAEEKPNG
ncbi:MAG: AGE family epimerase/isomerase [Bacteroidota bacterium]